jgi:hypothetical protein
MVARQIPVSFWSLLKVTRSSRVRVISFCGLREAGGDVAAARYRRRSFCCRLESDGFSHSWPLNLAFPRHVRSGPLAQSTVAPLRRQSLSYLLQSVAMGCDCLRHTLRSRSCAGPVRLPSGQIVKSGRPPTSTRVSVTFTAQLPRWPLPPACRKAPALYTLFPIPRAVNCLLTSVVLDS